MDQEGQIGKIENSGKGKKTIKTSTGLIVIFVAVVLFFGGAMTYWYYNDPNSYDSSKDSTQVATKSNSNANASTTADWKTYTNTTDNYSIKYPKTWEYKLDNSGVGFRETGKTYAVEGTDIAAITISVANNTDSKTLTQIANAQNETGSPVSLKLADVDALKITNKNVIRVLCIENNKIYSISANNIGEDAINKAILIVFNQMLPSFKFTAAASSATTSTADWKTYTGTGYTLKYPKTWITYNNELAGAEEWYETQAQQDTGGVNNNQFIISTSTASTTIDALATERKTATEEADTTLSIIKSATKISDIDVVKLVATTKTTSATAYTEYIFKVGNLNFVLIQSKATNSDIESIIESIKTI